jgi:myo-inositol 2-dehydrogenase / D-chiro-inositol 1-dehydrogenase
VIAFPVFAKYEDVDTAVATLKLSGGALAVLSVTRHNPLGYDVRMELFGSKDSIAVGWDERAPLRPVEKGSQTSPVDPYPNFQDRFRAAYEAEMAAFVEVAGGRRESPCTAEDALEALRVALACELSRKEHRPVLVKEIT